MNKLLIASCLVSSFSLAALAEPIYQVGEMNHSRILSTVSEELRRETFDRREQMERYGYYETYSLGAVNIYNIKNRPGRVSNQDEPDPYFSNLRLDTKDFELSFPFDDLRWLSKTNLLGFVPSGTYRQGKWTALTAYFSYDVLGVCRYVVSDMVSMNGKVFYDKQMTKFDVNNKPTITHAEGSNESGYLYTLSWSGQRYDKILMCADKKPFSRQVTIDMIKFAKKIDIDMPDTP